MGQALTQMPQAMHLEAGFSSFRTMTFMGQAATNAQLLVDHVNAGLGVLGDGAVLTDLGALAALDASLRLGTGALGNDLDAAEILMELLIECVRAGTDTLEACHAFGIFLDSELLHNENSPFMYFLL